MKSNDKLTAARSWLTGGLVWLALCSPSMALAQASATSTDSYPDIGVLGSDLEALATEVEAGVKAAEHYANNWIVRARNGEILYSVVKTGNMTHDISDVREALVPTQALGDRLLKEAELQAPAYRKDLSTAGALYLGLITQMTVTANAMEAHYNLVAGDASKWKTSGDEVIAASAALRASYDAARKLFNIDYLQQRAAEADAKLLAADMTERWRRQITGQGVAVGLSLPLGAKSPQATVGRVLSQLLGVVGGVALLFFVVGGIQWMTAAGNPERLKSAKATVLWSVLGLVVIFGAYAIVNFLITSLTG